MGCESACLLWYNGGMNTFVFLLAAAAVFGPSGEKVCDVTLPALPQGARVEFAG